MYAHCVLGQFEVQLENMGKLLYVGFRDDPDDRFFIKAVEKELKRELAKKEAKRREIAWSDETYERYFHNKTFRRGVE